MRLGLALVLAFTGGVPAPAQLPAKPVPSSVQVMFLPPPSEAGAVYSVGVYEAKTGQLARRLHEGAEVGAFTAGLNGFITSWDRKDDTGKIVPAGRYAARGWAVGEMRVEGVDVLGNDWAAEDESLRIKRVEAMDYVLGEGGLVLLVETADGRPQLIRVSGRDGAVVWQRPVAAQLPAKVYTDGSGRVYLGGNEVCYELASGQPAPRPSPQDICGTEAFGESRWMFTPQGMFEVLNKDSYLALQSPSESNRDAEIEKCAVRSLLTEPNQPRPVFVTPDSPDHHRLYLLEESSRWQRVRGLEWSETKPENGRPVSEWRTFFERNIRRPDPALGLDEKAPSPVVEFPLAQNPLEPGKPQRAKLRAGFDAQGSYLETADGLRLLPVSTRANLRAARLVRDPKTPDRLLFYQFDGAAWDVFGVSGVPQALVGFDAGEFELTADGERRPPPPTEEPRGF